MPPQHSSLEGSGTKVGGIALFPLRNVSKARGPAPITMEEDIVDNTLALFKTYEVEKDADRVLVYLTLYIVECLKRMQKTANKDQAEQDMYSFALEPFALPGSTQFPL